MLVWLLASVGCFLFIESFIRLGFTDHCNDVRIIISKSVHVIQSSKISDHWKEKVVLSYAIKLGVLSIKLLVFLIVSLSPFYIIDLVAGCFGLDLMGFLVSPVGLVWSTISGTIYAYYRVRFVRK